jgi:WD40 repeat protein
MSADGRVFGAAMVVGGLVWHADLAQPPSPIGPHHDARFVDVSPDGRFVATGSHFGTKVKIWDAMTRQLARELPVEGSSHVLFSPDNRWLVTTYEGIHLWALDSEQPPRKIDGWGGIAFSPDGRILATDTDNGAIRLVDPENGRDYARLEDPYQDRAMRVHFAPDGAQLVGTNESSNSIHVWNLRSIRDALAEMGLDWDLPAYAADPRAEPLTTVVSVDDIADH